MTQFGEKDSMELSQAESELPNYTPSKGTSDEFQLLLDGDMSTTKLKAVKIEKD